MGSNFGLGLVLTFTDKASAGIAGAVGMFNSLQKATDDTSSKLGALGGAVSSLSSLGAGLTASITAPVTAFLGKITQYGIARASFVEDMHLAFTSLMGDAKSASDYMNQLMGFAKTTPYTYEGITNSAQLLISYGYKVNDILTETNGKYAGILQAVGDWAGATGRGEAGMMAVSEILGKINAEGKIGTERLQQLQLAGIQASDIIGNMYNMSTDKAAEFIKTMDVNQFVSDLTKGLEEGTKGVNGMTGAMAGQMMNLKNTWTGAKDTFISSLKTAGLELMGAYTDDTGVQRYEFLEKMTVALNNLSASIKKISPVLQPVVSLVEKVMTKGSELILKLTTSFDEMSDTGKSAVSKFVSALVLLGPMLLIVGKLGGGVLTLTDTFKGLFNLTGPGFKKMGIALGAFYLLWKTDFLGMRTMTTKFFTTVMGAFSKAKEGISGSLVDMRIAISELDRSTFTGNLTYNLMRLMTVFKAVSEMWGDYTLSDETFRKANELGVLPLIESIFDLKYRFSNFKQGFIDGWTEIKDAVVANVESITGKVKGTFLGDMLDKLEEFFSFLSDNDPDAWKDAGNTFSKVAVGLITLWGALKLFRGVASIFGKAKSVGGAISNVLDLGKDSGGDLMQKNSFLSNPGRVLKTMGSIAIIVMGTVALLTVLGSFTKNSAVQMFISGGIDTIVKVFDALIPIAGSIAVLGVLAKAFDLLKVNPSTAAKGIANFAILLGGFEILLAAMGSIAKAPDMEYFIGAGAEVIPKLFSTLEGMFNLKALAVIGLIAILGHIDVATAAMGIANFALILGAVTLLIAAFGALKMIPGFDDFIEGGGDTMALVFAQIGKCVGAVIAGFGEGVTSTLPQIGQNIADFGTNIQPFFTAVQGAPTEKIGSFLTSLGAFVALVAGEQFLTAFTGGLDLVSVATQLVTFGSTVGPFFESVATFNDTGIDKAPRVFAALAGMGNYDFKTWGLAQLFSGTTDFDNIAIQLSNSAEPLKTFFESAASFNEAGLTKAPQVFSALAGMGNYDFKSWGLAQLFSGTTDFDNIAEQLGNSAGNLSDFFEKAAKMSSAGITKAPKIFAALGSVGNYDFKTWGLAQLVTGSTDIATIGTQLTNFMTNSEGFFSKLADIDNNNIDKTKTLFDSLAVVGNYDFKTWGLAQLVTGSTDISTIGTQLTSFIDSALPFFETMDEIEYSAITKTKNMFAALNEIGGEMKSGGLLQVLVGQVNLVPFGVQLSGFGPYAVSFFASMAKVDSAGFSKARGVFNALENVKVLVDAAVGSNGSVATFGGELVSFATDFKTFLATVDSIEDTNGVDALSKSLGALDTTFGTFSGTISTNSTTVITAMDNTATCFERTDSRSSVSFSNMNATVSSFKSSFSVAVSGISSLASNMSSAIYSMESSVSGSISRLQNTFNNATFRLNIPKIPSYRSLVPAAATGVDNFVGGLIQINENGGELVNLPSGSTVIPHDESIKESLSKGMKIGAESMALYAANAAPAPVYATTPKAGVGRVDYNINFGKESIVVRCESTQDKDLEKTADKLFRIIQRKLELKRMAERKTKQPVY